MALIGQQLYVLRRRKCEELDVYSTADYSLLRRINIDALNKNGDVSLPTDEKYWVDMASCPVKRCLYLISESSTVHRIDLPGKISQCKIADNLKVYGISVEQNCNLLVSAYRCGGPYVRSGQDSRCTLVEWNWEASKVIRQVALTLEIGGAQPEYFSCHPLQLSSGSVVVYHRSVRGYSSDSHHRVSIVGKRKDGSQECEIRFYGGSYGGTTVGRLNAPCHMAVDPETESIFVADSGNGRVIVLNRSLLFLRSITDGMVSYSSRVGLKRICYDHVTRRLYAGLADEGGGVLKVLKFSKAAAADRSSRFRH